MTTVRPRPLPQPLVAHRSALQSDSRVLRSETKRRRLEATRTTSDSSSQALPILPAAPHHTFPFHRKLQEHAFSRLSDLLSRHEFLLADLAKTLTSLNTVAAAQTVHRQTMTDSLGNVNSILSLAAALTQSTQTRTGEATQISTDIQSFIARWAQYMSDVRKPGTDLAPLSQTAEELWAGGGALWDGLFEGIEFDGTKDDQKEWEEAVASVASIDDGGNLPPIADNYNAVLAMFDEQFGSTRDLTAGFRKAVARIVRSVATVLLVKMAELERDLVRPYSSRRRIPMLTPW